MVHTGHSPQPAKAESLNEFVNEEGVSCLQLIKHHETDCEGAE